MSHLSRLLCVMLLAALTACSGATAEIDPDFVPPDPVDPNDRPVFAASLLLTSSRPQLYTDESSFQTGVEITATALDASNAAIENASVDFKVLTGGGALSLGAGQRTGSDGTLTSILHSAGGAARFITVQASSGTKLTTITVPVLERSSTSGVNRILLTTSRQSLFTDEDSFDEGILLQATALNGDGVAVPDVPVSFSILSGGGALSRGAGVTTDQSGIATSVLHSAGGTPREITVRVTAGVVQQQLTLNVVQRTAFNPVDRIVISASKAALLVTDNTFEKGVTLTAQFLDPDGVTVSGVPASFGILSGGGALTVAPDQSADGSRTAVLHSAGGQARDIVVRVSTGDVTALISIPVRTEDAPVGPEVDRVLLTATSLTLSPAQSTQANGLTITATAVSPGGVPVPLAPVSFSIVSGGGLVFPGGSLTASNGSLDAVLTTGGNPTPRSITVQASSGGKSATLTIVVQQPSAALRLLTSSPALPSAARDNADGLIITALAVDGENRRLAGLPVVFSTSSGVLAVLDAETNSNGEARATLTTGGDPTARSILVDVRVAGAAVGSGGTISVPVTGTTVALIAPQVTAVGRTEEVKVVLKDSDGVAIANQLVSIASDQSASISPTSRVTNLAGEATFTYSPASGGTDTLTASAAGVIASAKIATSPFQFDFVIPEDGLEVPTGQSQPITVSLRSNGTPLAGASIALTSTRGQLSASMVVTNDDGLASATITSTGPGSAGGASIDASYLGVVANTTIEFLAGAPADLNLSSKSRTIPSGTSTDVVATVRDVDGNPVKGTLVEFVLTDPTLGALSAGTARTDSSGRATIAYTAGSSNSAPDAVRITATAGTAPSKTVRLTVGGQALRISLGTGNTISTDDTNTVYELPYSVLVTDAAGNPVSGVVVNFATEALTYQKGEYLIFLQADGTPVWQPVYSVSPATGTAGQDQFGCLNEDANRDGNLAEGEDFNANGRLDPGNIAAAPSSRTTDELGQVTFPVRYIKQFASWGRIRLTATAQVSGSESSESVDFVLPISAEDALNTNVAPPGRVSPFGVEADCANPG